LRLLVTALAGTSFFMLPIPAGESVTVPFDLLVQWILQAAPGTIAIFCFLLILAGAVGTILATLEVRRVPSWLGGYRTSRPLLFLRIAAVPLALIYLLRVGPERLLQPDIAGLMWGTLALSVSVIVPIGAALLGLFVNYGFIEFVGAMMRPIMRPLFRLPGRAALDSLTSWFGSYSVGLYLTRRLTREGYYTRREAYTIATCFSTVSIGFVAVVAQTLDLLHLFPVIFLFYFLAVYLLTSLLVRIPPISRIAETYLAEPQPEFAHSPGSASLLKEAWRRALAQAGQAQGVILTLREGFLDGLLLASTILGGILTVGTIAILAAKETPLFQLLGRPLVPVLAALGLPDAELLGPAALVGISEMYIPALLAREAALPGRFFICLLSISQLIFFSSVGPMLLDMFRDIPIRARDLIILFLMRTGLLIPFSAAVTMFVF